MLNAAQIAAPGCPAIGPAEAVLLATFLAAGLGLLAGGLAQLVGALARTWHLLPDVPSIPACICGHCRRDLAVRLEAVCASCPRC